MKCALAGGDLLLSAPLLEPGDRRERLLQLRLEAGHARREQLVAREGEV